jgi:hypothetical protein
MAPLSSNCYLTHLTGSFDGIFELFDGVFDPSDGLFDERILEHYNIVMVIF